MSAGVFALTAHQVRAQSGTVYNNYGADTLLPIPCTGFSSPGAAMSCAMAANLVNPAYYIFSAPSLTPGYTNLYQETCSPTPAGVAAGHSACGAYYAEASACSGAQCGMKDVGNCSSCAGDPIAMAIGSKFLEERDFVASNAGPLRFVRFYNSSSVGAFASSLSPGWMHNYAMTVNTLSATSVLMTRADGKTFTFNLIGSIWTPDADVSDRLVQLTSGSTVTGWQYTNASDDSLETYDAHGNLSSIVYREGTSVNLAYATGSSAPTFPAQLLSVTDSFGLQLTFKYSFNPDKVTMTDPKGEVYTYTIGSMVQLASVTYPDSTYKSYLYNEAAYTGGQSIPFALTGVIDESNSRYDSTWYNANGIASQTALAGPATSLGVYVSEFALTNTFDGTGRIASTSILNPLGATLGASFTNLIGRNRFSGATQPAVSGQPAGSQIFAFDAQGNISESIDLNGNVTCSVYDLTRNLETGRVEGLAPGSTCPANISTYVPTAGTVQRKILTQYHPIWHLPAKRAEPLKITTWVFNGDGGVYCAPTTAKVGVNPIGVVCSRSEQATTDATGGSGFSATDSGSPRVWSYTYNAFGKVLTAKGPRTDVNDTTTYTYYTCATGAQCGQIDTITNAIGQITTFNTYNGNGQPLTITDPNGTVTTLTYDARQHIKSIEVGTETTGYTYYPTGLLETVTLPDASTMANTYDSAHRLIQVADGLGNYVKYTLDAAGNRTAINVYDSSNTLRQTHTQEFNALGTLYEDITAANTAAVTTTYGYDAQGNQTSTAAPLSRNTANAFDALNRLDKITDPKSGITKVTYDARDNVASVIDPRSFTTSYTHDGFDELTELVSPDSGASSNTYDSGGNLKTTTDARGAVGTYTYDALNRVTQVAYTDQTIKFTYDAGTNGKGRLTGASDAYHSMSWSYDSHGRVTGKGQTVASITKSVGYSYTNADMTSVVTPSGQTITYGYTNHRITSISVNGTTLLSGATYFPLGPISAWTWGNSTPVSRTYNTDRQVSEITTAGDVFNFGYDNALRITGIVDSESYVDLSPVGYDALDRLSSATNSGTAYGWTYDANGNALTLSGPTATTYTPSTSSNRLSSTAGALVRTYGYDAAGDTTSYTGVSFAFNQRGRMSSATTAAGATDYIYNALGQLIEKYGAGGTTLLLYDEAGHLLGEYSSTGALIQETVWMDDTPVATLRPNGSTISVYYVHTDHLNSPLAITQPTTHALMWFWAVGGTGSPNQNPLNQGTFVYNLRYPGQYFQAETGLYYNYFRDYDPQTGRYIESDPLGLAGGQLTTYGYVDNNPISNIDPSGTGPAGAAIGGIVGGVIGGIVGSESGPGDAAAIAAGRAIGRAVGSAIENSCQTCPACTPYAKGTKGYIGPHTDHDHFPIGRPHLNLFEVNQNPSTCKCFWNKANPDVAAPPPQAGWVDLNSGFPPLSP